MYYVCMYTMTTKSTTTSSTDIDSKLKNNYFLSKTKEWRQFYDV